LHEKDINIRPNIKKKIAWKGYKHKTKVSRGKIINSINASKPLKKWYHMKIANIQDIKNISIQAKVFCGCLILPMFQVHLENQPPE
jgi:hypothetical protein